MVAILSRGDELRKYSGFSNLDMFFRVSGKAIVDYIWVCGLHWPRFNDFTYNWNELSHQDFLQIMKWIKYCLLILVCCTVVRPSTQCLSRYITRPINGYYCHQQCIGACISNKTCWTLSFSHSGQVYALEKEPCVNAKKNNDLSIMILRSTPFPRCLGWVSFNDSYGSIKSFPKRAMQIRIKRNRMAAMARRVSTNRLLTGRSTSKRYKTYLMDSQGNFENLSNGYEILLVVRNCSTAWVSYTAGDPIPTGAFVAGKDNLTGRNHYVVDSKDTAYMKLTTYAEGTGQWFFYCHCLRVSVCPSIMSLSAR